MDIASIVGLVMCFGLMFYGITGSNGMSAIWSFLDRDSAVLTVRDRGFGEFFENSYRIWEKVIKF